MHESSLPAGCMIAVLNRMQAAEYVGVSPSVFDTMVAGGRMPKAIVLSERRYGFIRSELDAALQSLQRKGDDLAERGVHDEPMTEEVRALVEKLDATRKARKA